MLSASVKNISPTLIHRQAHTSMTPYLLPKTGKSYTVKSMLFLILHCTSAGIWERENGFFLSKICIFLDPAIKLDLANSAPIYPQTGHHSRNMF